MSNMRVFLAREATIAELFRRIKTGDWHVTDKGAPPLPDQVASVNFAFGLTPIGIRSKDQAPRGTIW